MLSVYPGIMANPVRIVPPVFPLDTLAPWQRAMVEQTAMSTQTDPVMAAVVSLGVLSATIARKTTIVMPSGYASPAHIWVTVVAGAGEAKSRVMGSMAGPLKAVQDDLDFPATTHDAPPIYRRSAIEHALGDWMNEDLRFEAGGSTMDEAARLVRQRQELVDRHVRPQIVTTDITPTRLFDLLGEQAAPVALISPEAGFETWLNGARVSAQERSALNLIWDGDTVRRQRQDRTVFLRRPALAMIIGMQPVPTRALVTNPQFRGTGYALRTIWCMPESRRGFTTAPFQPPKKTVVEEYNARVWQMLALGGLHALERPRTLQISRHAARAYDIFFNQTQLRIRPGGDLEMIADYVERLRTNIPRIAGVLHVAAGMPRHGDSILGSDVGEETMEAAISVAEVLLAHGQAVFGGKVRRSPVDALISFTPREGWHGRASDLFVEMNREVPPDSRTDDWPGAANALSRYLRGHEDDLAARGLALRLRHTVRGSNITLRWRSSSSSLSSAAAPEEARLEPDGADDDDDPQQVVEGNDD